MSKNYELQLYYCSDVYFTNSPDDKKKHQQTPKLAVVIASSEGYIGDTIYRTNRPPKQNGKAAAGEIFTITINRLELLGMVVTAWGDA